MDWNSWYAKYGTPAYYIVLLLSVSMIVFTGFNHTFSLDAYWHVQTAKDWLENGLSPFIDHYSFTFEGQPISYNPVLVPGTALLPHGHVRL